MTGQEKQGRQEMKGSMKKNMAASSSDDEDSDVERNFALLTGRRGGGAEKGEQCHGGEEEEEFTDDEAEVSDGGEEEGGEEGSDVGEEVSAGRGEEGSDVGEKVSDGRGEEGSDVGEEVSDSGEEEGDEEGSDVDEEVSDGGEEDGDAPEEDVDVDPEDGGEIQTRDDIKKELSNMSFEDIIKLQNKVGTKVYNEVAYGSNKSPAAGKKKRLNKNRPTEISSKKRAPFLRQVISAKKPTLRDPRFDDLSGEYKPEIFEKTYNFINDIKHREKEIVQKQLKKMKTKNTPKKEKLQFLLKRMENQERARKSREQQRERELQFKRQQRERANQGTQPFFLKNSEKKKLQLAEKYQELKKSGKLENFLSKKRKRNAGKDRRKLPKQLQNTKTHT